jgi:hypothetical protein
VDCDKDVDTDSILDSFYESIFYKRYWKLLGIDNELSVKSGKLEEWDLKESVISHGICLYGKYMSELDGKLYSMFLIDVSGKQNEKLKIWRKIYGYKQKVGKKEYSKNGLLAELNGIRLGPSVIAVPLDESNKMRQFLSKNKVNHKIVDILSDGLE